jgi:hypothetical protein
MSDQTGIERTDATETERGDTETDHDDTEALALILDKCSLSGQECRKPPPRYSELTDDRNTHWHRRAAEDGESMIQLATYVARKVEGVERERDEARRRSSGIALAHAEQCALDEHRQRLAADRRAERAERERDEAREVVERVLADCDGAIAQESVLGEQVVTVRWLRAALAPAIEPASARPLTLDEHLAEVERRIEEMHADAPGFYDPVIFAVRAYREEVRRDG